MLIDAIAAGWKANRGPLLVIGHVDEAEMQTGSHLDSARAHSVRDALVGRGVDVSALSTRAEAFDDPLVLGSGPEAQNRYVTVVAPEAGVNCVSTPGIIR